MRKGGRNDKLTRHRGAQRHEYHCRDRVFEADGAAKVGSQVPREGGEHPDEADGDEEAGPAAPVLGGRHKGEQDFPEDSQEVHDVVEAGRQALFSRVLVLVVTWRRGSVRKDKLTTGHIWGGGQ